MIESASLLKQFFLGDLPGDEQDRIEREYFSDCGRFEQLEVAENGLIDSYVRGGLSEEERQRFRLHYLTSPERHSKVNFARSLIEVAHSAGPPFEKNETAWWDRWFRFGEPTRFSRLAIVSGCFAVTLATGALFLMQNRELKQELRKQETTNAELRESQEALARQVAQLGSSLSESVAGNRREEQAMLESPLLPGASLTLLSSVRRGGEGSKPAPVLPIRGASVRIKLVLEENEQDVRTFDAELQLVGSHEVPLTISGHSIAKGVNGTTVLLDIPSKSIQPGDYILTLYGLDAGSTRNEVGSYTFRAINGAPRLPE